MNGPTYIVDANNLIHRHPELRGLARTDFEQARRQLVHLLNAGVAGSDHVIVVFDWKGGPPPAEFKRCGVEVHFSKGNESADTVIERLVKKSADPGNVTVVTSDRLEQLAVQSAGGLVMSCDAFIDYMEDRTRGAGAAAKRLNQKPPANRLGDFFPQK